MINKFFVHSAVSLVDKQVLVYNVIMLRTNKSSFISEDY